MIRAKKLAVYRPMYAFKPDTWTKTSSSLFVVRAVWFKRKNGQTVATMGTYLPLVHRWDQRPDRDTYEAWITAADDNRYGGSWLASWDGEGLLNFDGAVSPATSAERVEFLDAMLKGYPDPPEGYDGWWTFEKKASG